MLSTFAILPFVGRFSNLARTVKGKTRFPFRIVLVPKDQPVKRKVRKIEEWRHRAMYNIKILLMIQISRSSNRVKQKWQCFYSVSGYGAPGAREFICPYSSMIAKTIKQDEAMSFRKYWANCLSKSKEILQWLDTIHVSLYSKELNHYLLRLIVIVPNQKELERYKKTYPFQGVKAWQEL